jgi:3-methyl-2-oxobutanoate hydroxymethyltransferase
MTITHLQRKKNLGEKISMITCYDSSFAKIVNQSPIDLILVGDSAAMTMHGHQSTLPIDIATMALHISAVVRGAPDKFIIGDMPFLSYRKDFSESVESAGQLMKAGAHAIKLEGAKGNLELIEHLVDSGIPVMGHLGLTPQSVHQIGGFKVQAKDTQAAELLSAQAKALQAAGCFSLVLEAIPSSLAALVTQELQIPTIGIGAGVGVDGQVLVLQDMLGMNPGFKPKFLRTYLDGHALFLQAFTDFHEDVVQKNFPSEKESYL